MIVAPQGSTDQKEHGGNGNEQISAEEGGEAGFAIRLGGMIALHVVLVDAVVLQIGEDSIYEAYPERAFAKRGERERA